MIDVLDKSLPRAEEQEKLILGLAQSDFKTYWEKIEHLSVDVFTTQANKQIFSRMVDIATRGESFERLTVYAELEKWGQVASSGGLAFLVDLDSNAPPAPDIDAYVKAVVEAHARRRVIYAAQQSIHKAMLGQESAEAIASSLEESVRGIGEQKRDRGRTPIEIIRDGGGISVFLDPTLSPKGIQTGITAFDEQTTGLHGDQLVIIAARPSMGKTALAAGIAEYVTRSAPVPMFSLEMGGGSIIRRMVCAKARVSLYKFRSGFLDANERSRVQESMAEITERPFRLYDNPGMTIGAICKEARHEVEREGAKLVIVDHLGLISTKGMKFDRKDLEIGYITRTLKMLSKQLNVPIMVLCQLSRDSAKTRGARPELHDLRNSGDIEQDADIAAFIYREDYYHRDREDIKGTAELLIRKQRDGAVGCCYMRFRREYAYFDNPLEGEKTFAEY